MRGHESKQGKESTSKEHKLFHTIAEALAGTLGNVDPDLSACIIDGFKRALVNGAKPESLILTIYQVGRETGKQLAQEGMNVVNAGNA